jgi:glutamate racemase
MAKIAAPIGVFDSGVGGLSVLREIRRQLPWENLIYVADSRHVPYGSKSPEFIVARGRVLAKFLLEHECKAIVIACNTATVRAAQCLRQDYPAVPIVGMEPAVKPAVAATKCGIVGVLATVGTLQSAKFAGLLDKFATGVRVVTQPAPGLVERVEAGDLSSPATRALVASFVNPLLAAGADTIVLGCTHYPFLRPLIQELVGPSVTLIDTGAAVARQLTNRLHAAKLLQTQPQPAEEMFYTSAATADRSAWDVLWPSHGTVRHAAEIH